MKDEKDESYERRMQMWRRRDELLNSMSEKELRAFIKGYMMAERMVLKRLGRSCRCGGEACQESSCCRGESCGCGGKECNCEKDQ